MNKAIKTYSFFIFLLFIMSMGLWIGWDGRRSLILTLCGCGALLVKMMYNIPFVFSKRNIAIVIAFYIAYLYRLGGSFEQFFTQIPSQLIPIICIICILGKYKEIILKYITKWYAYLILISLFVFILVYTVHIPGFGSLEFADDSNYGTYINYIFYVERIDTLTGGLPRFNGPFLEPGYVGMIGAFLLFANKFNFKTTENKIILVSVLASFSLAGWMLLIIGYILNIFYNGKISVSRLVFSLLLIVSIINGAKYYNGGNNMVNETILSRLETDEEKGFAGNNRNTETIKLLAAGIWTSGDIDTILFGYDEDYFRQYEEWELVGSGVDKFFVHHGLIGILLALSLYIITVTTAHDKKFALLFFIFMLFSFWQRCYALWFSWIICFYYASVITDSLKYNRKIKQI